MMITLIKKQRGTDVIKDLIQKYGSKKELERLFNQTNNMEMMKDLENWNYFLENPNEIMEKGRLWLQIKLIYLNWILKFYLQLNIMKYHLLWI